jgi:hypothetical protein
MAKTILAFAIAFFGAMTVFASAAEACISCNYVPEVVNSPSKSDSAKRYNKKRVNRAAKKRKSRPAKKRVTKRKTITEKVETAETAPIKTETKNENSTITKKVETAKTAPIKTETKKEKSSISTASNDNDETIEMETKAKDEPKVTRRAGCKRFFPTIGESITVPCE